MTAWTTTAVTALLAAVTFALYWPTLRLYFIADDLVTLRFLRSHEGSWLAFLNPARIYSDPVTRTRYKPLFVYYYRALDALLGDRVFAYHSVSLAMHALVGALVWRLAWALFEDRVVATAAAILFVAWRLQCQAVAWISAGFRLPSTGLALLALIWARERERGSAVPIAVTLSAVALAMNPDLVVVPAIVASFLVHDRVERGSDAGRSRRLAWTLGGCAVVAAAFLLATWRSGRAFPERPIALVPDPARVLLFATNLFVPFALPLWLKIALTGIAIAAALAQRDGRLRLLLACAAPSALLWALLRAYPLAPRYLYLSWAFGAIVVARLACQLGSRAVLALAGVSRSCLHRPARLRAAAAAALLSPLLLASAWAIRAVDLVHLDYLALLGQRLGQVESQARDMGRRISVFVRPFSPLGGGDLSFFRHVDFVRSPAAADRIVDTDLERYRRRLGPRMADAYWYLPWFDRDVRSPAPDRPR